MRVIYMSTRHVYTLKQKGQAKALVLATGSAPRAHEVLGGLWDVVPTARAIRNWVHDQEIEADADFLEVYSATIDGRILGMVDSMLGPLRDAVLKGLKDGAKAIDIHNHVRSFVFAANLVRPANASGAGGTNVLGNQVNVYNAPGAAQFMPWGPAQPAESPRPSFAEAIDVPLVPSEAPDR